MIKPADYVRTLYKEAGIANAALLQRPDSDRNPLWTLAVDIGQSELLGRIKTGDDYSLSLVGAADVDRLAVFQRAAGEAVERWALKPSSHDRPLNGKVTAPSGASWNVPTSIDYPVYPAIFQDESGVREASVPAGAVDYPCDSEDSGQFDPGPSGAAAGDGLRDAINRACCELLERDAAMRAWLSKETLSAVDVGSIGSEALQFGRLVHICQALRLDYAVAYLPSPYENVRPVMAMIVDRFKGVASAGLALERCDSRAAAKALQEALQVRTVLTARESKDRLRPPAIIQNDGERARFWSSPAGVAAGEDWIRRVQPNSVPLLTNTGTSEWREAVGLYTVVDLTKRLPDQVREMGWSVVKIFAPALQPLRMSEALSWNILRDVDVCMDIPHPFV